jgi:nitrite reductase (NADH) small subunit
MNEWRAICPVQRLPVDRGVAALLDGEQVAVFRTSDDRLHAVSNEDPFSGAMVLSRGIVGSRGDRSTVASPLHKQVFDLETGQCLDDARVALVVHDVRVTAGVVEVALRRDRRLLAG